MLDADKNQGVWPNADFEVTYEVWGDNINSAVAIQAPSSKVQQSGGGGGCCGGGGKATSVDKKGTFCLSIAPPKPERVQLFPRSVIFIIDK